MTNGSPDQREGGQVERVVTLADDALYRALASTARRRLLAVLRSEGGGTSVDELATLLCAWDATSAGTMGTPRDRDRLLVALTHVHLPQLDTIGLVEYDRDSGTVAPRPLDPGVEELVHRSVDAESTSPA